MIVKDEERTLGRVLKLASEFCDELIVVDTGSTDRSIEIAKEAGAKVFHFDWIYDFAAARNYSFSKCASDWIIWLDADDVLSPRSIHEIKQLKAKLTEQHDGVAMTYRYVFSPQGDCLVSYLRERILRRGAGPHWVFPVHECIELKEMKFALRPDITIDHKPDDEKQKTKVGRNLKILEEAIKDEATDPRNLFNYAKELCGWRKFELASEYYDRYLDRYESETSRYDAMMGKVACLMALKRDNEGAALALEALMLDSSRADAFNQLGLFHFRKSDWKKAIPFFSAAVSLPVPLSNIMSSVEYTSLPNEHLSICHARLGDMKKAMEFALKSLENLPDKTAAIKNLHWMVDRL